MAVSPGKTYLRALGLGLLAGARSVTPLELVVREATDNPGGLADSPLHLLLDRRARLALGVATVGEFGIDQAPFVPNRTDLLPLFGRIFFGALTGAVAAVQARRPPAVGAMLGGVGGFLGTHASYQLRRRATEALHLPGPIAGLAEDALVVALGQALLRATK